MKRMKWSEGWHEASPFFSYFVEDGKLRRGMVKRDGGWDPVLPYVHAKEGGYDLCQSLTANLRNYNKILWH